MKLATIVKTDFWRTGTCRSHRAAKQLYKGGFRPLFGGKAAKAKIMRCLPEVRAQLF
jgi:hypothetical protein